MFAFTAAVFLTSLPAFLEVWSAQPYTHGYLIAVAVVWLVWRERDVFRNAQALWLPGLAVAVAASVLWLVATIADAQTVVLACVPLVLLAWAGAVFGREAALRLAPIAAIFMLAVPLWEVFTRPLQWLTIAVSGRLETLFHVPATIEGNLVHITYGTFEIAGGCAGLNYFMSGLTIGALYAQIFLRRWPARIAAVTLAGILAIVGNWIRVSTVIAVGHFTKMQAGIVNRSLPHIVYGWGIFLATVVAFFFLVRVIERWERRHRSVGARQAPHQDDPSAPASGTTLRPAAYATMAALVGPMAYLGVGALPTHDPGAFVARAPSPTWRAAREQAERPYAWQPAFGGAQEHVVSRWSDGNTSVLLDHIVYHHQSQGAELIGYTSRIAPDGDVLTARLRGPVGSDRRLVNEAIVRNGEGYVLVWYWYRVGGVEAVEPIRAKLLEVWAFFSRRKVSELIAFSAPCGPDSCEGAFDALSAFFGA